MELDELPIKIDVKIDSADMRKAFNKLIDTISSPFRWFATYKEPVKLAKAEVEAALIRVNAIGPLSESLGISKEEAISMILRSDQRDQYEKIRQQNNIEKIVQISTKMLPSSVNDLSVDEDWTVAFFDQCKNISDEEMHTLWAKILAGEVAHPGTYSRRVLSFIKTLSRQEADTITKFCSFLWKDSNVGFIHILMGNGTDFLENNGIQYTDLIELESLGIMRFDINTFISFDFKDELPPLLFYHGEPHYLYMANRELAPKFNILAMTSLGNCLAPIAGSVRNEKYYLESIDEFKKNGFYISDKPPRE